MEIWQLKYFIQVCNDKCFTQAAEKLHISQQGLSKAIKNLEDELEISLFERSSRGVKPTAFGGVLLEKCQFIVKEFDFMVDFLYDKAKLKKETITLGVPYSIYTSFFSTILYEFQETYPDIKLEIVESGSHACERGIKDDLLDISFAFKPIDTEKFQFYPVTSCDMVLLVNRHNPLAQNSDVKFKDLENEKFIMLSQEYRSRHLTIQRCLQSGFKPTIDFTASQIDLIIELVGLNKGIAILPELDSVKAENISDKVSILPFKDTPFKVEIGFIINKYKILDYITNSLINYTLKFFEEKKLVNA